MTLHHAPLDGIYGRIVSKNSKFFLTALRKQAVVVACVGLCLGVTTTPVYSQCGPSVFLLKWAAGFENAVDVAVDQDGFVYVVDASQNRVQKFDGQGNLITLWGSFGSGLGELQIPYSVAVGGPEHHVYVTERNNYRVQEFDRDGTPIQYWGSRGTEPGEFTDPRGIATGPNGGIFVIDSYLRRLYIYGGPSSGTWDLTASFRDPQGIAVDSQGSVYIADLDWDLVKKFDSMGNHILTIGGSGTGPGLFNTPVRLDVDSNDYLYVVDAHNDRVQVFDPNGSYCGEWGREGGNDGEFGIPNGIAVDGMGNIYVSDSTRDIVQKFGEEPIPVVRTSWGRLKASQ